jgi:TonB family protein
MQAVLAFALLMPLLLQPQLPDPAAIAKQSAAAAEKYHTLQYVGESTVEMLSGPLAGTKTTTEVSRFVKNPGRSRVEAKAQGQLALTVVSDGEYIWAYNSATKQYTKTAAAMGMMGVVSSLTSIDMSSVMSGAKTNQRTIREDSVEVDGRARPCWVVEVRIEKMTLPAPQNASGEGVGSQCIDKELGISLQSAISITVTTTSANVSIQTEQKGHVRGLKIDESLDDALFTFAPPPDAREVAALFNPALPRPNLIGSSAPAFDVKALSGASFSLASLKGQTVLLDFWTTWCEPCRKAMPVLESLYLENRDKKLVILGVDAGENRQTVEKFLRTATASYPTVLGVESDILHAFQVSAYPTYVLIDPAGKIVAHQIGYPGEAGLRRMLTRGNATGGPGPSIPIALGDPNPIPPDLNRVGNGVTPPTVLSRIEPQYSDSARAARIQGTVVLEAFIDENGVPKVLRVVRSLDPELDQNAIAAIEQWRFKPGTRNGIPVKVALNIEVNFNLGQR